MLKLKIDWMDFELAVESQSAEMTGYLDTKTGAVLVIAQETLDLLERLLDDAPLDSPVEPLIAAAEVPAWQKEALREASRVRENLDFKTLYFGEAEWSDDYRDLADFTATVQDARVRQRLEQAIEGRGAFRRFRDVVHHTIREREQWHVFQAQRRREKAAAWLARRDIEVEWVLPPPRLVPARPPSREHLLGGVLAFVRAATQIAGVQRVALVGELTGDETEPHGADVLVTISDPMDLAPLATAGRKLSGYAQQVNRGASVFLANERGEYLGRTCPWRDCGPVFRTRCDALHCGQRTYLHDDLRTVKLFAKTIAAPPIDLWPTQQARVPVPEDVEQLLLAPLREKRG